MKKFKIKEAFKTDLSQIIELLKVNDLPFEDLKNDFDILFLKVEENEDLIGSVGLEKYGQIGLLRSLAVDDKYKGQGIGKELVKALLNKASELGINEVYLLTTTADNFFPKFGFKSIERTEADEAIQQSSEFKDICPASAVVMMITL